MLLLVACLDLTATAASSPTISFGAGPAEIGDPSTTKPFANISIADADGDNVTVTISFPPEHGTFPTAILSTNSSGVYTLTSRSAANAVTFLSDVVFTPIANRIPLGSTETTTFTLTVTDTTSASATASVNLVVHPVNDPPTISFTSPDPPDITDKTTTGRPLQKVVVNDPDAGDALTTTIQYTARYGTFPTGGGLAGVAGNYSLSVRSAADVQTFLRALTFTPTENIIPLDEEDDVVFTVTVTDLGGPWPVVLNPLSDTDTETQTVTPVPDPPALLGFVTNSIPDNTISRPFSNLVVYEPDVIRRAGQIVTQEVTLKLILPESTPVGTFVGNLLGTTNTGLASAVTLALDNIAFDPVPNRQNVGLTETLEIEVDLRDEGGMASLENGTQSIAVVSINDPPTSILLISPQTITDTTPETPFQLTLSDPDPNEQFRFEILPVSDPAFFYGVFDPASALTGSVIELPGRVANLTYRPFVDRATNQPVTFNVRISDQHADGVITQGLFTLTLQGVNNPPDITGTLPSSESYRITDDPNLPPLFPFPQVRITDSDFNQILTVTLSLTPSGLGTLSTTSLTGTVAQLNRAIREVNFSPIQTANREVGKTKTVAVGISVSDGVAPPESDNNTTINILAVNAAPTITGIPALDPGETAFRIDPASPVKPFFNTDPVIAVSIGDDDGTNVVLTVEIDDPAKGVFAASSLGDFVEDPAGSGVYRFVGLPAEATAAIRALEFVVDEDYPFPPGFPGQTRFTLTAEDKVLNRTVRSMDILLAKPPRNWLVTRTEDDLQPGSLRHAIQQIENAKANAAHVTFALEGYPETILLKRSNGPLILKRNITLKGPGADMLRISGDENGDGVPDVRLFEIEANVVIEGLTLTHGSALEGAVLSGGAVHVGPAGDLTLRSCVVANSVAAQWGGGIDVDGGALRLEHCLILGNRTDSSLGRAGGGVSLFTDRACSFVNTTFSGNRQESATGIGGGAIYAENSAPLDELLVSVTHCTFAENVDASVDGGTSIHANVFGTRVAVHNSIFADGLGRNLEVSGAAFVDTEDGNVSDDDTHTVLTQNGEPKLVILLNAENDIRSATGILAGSLDVTLRPVPGYRLATGSAAIGHAVEPVVSLDQRGMIRDADPDTGAIEAIDHGPAVTINEIHFAPATGDARFIEFYVPRDAATVDFSGLSLWVNGALRHTFDSGITVRRGFGLVVAEGPVAAFSTQVIQLPADSLGLTAEGLVELRRPASGAEDGLIARTTYAGSFADPFEPTNEAKFATNSITLAPQFRGFALLPHAVVKVAPGTGYSFAGADLDQDPTANQSSPGADVGQTPFGSDNAFPVAVADAFILDEDLWVDLPVLNNDFDADALDQVRIVDVSATESEGGDDATRLTAKGASVSVLPGASPLLGTSIVYDPTVSAALKQLPVGAETTDTFYYSILDFGHATIESYTGTPGNSPVVVRTEGHRLFTGSVIQITGAGTNNYNSTFTVNVIDPDTFSIPTNYVGSPTPSGSWTTVGPRRVIRVIEEFSGTAGNPVQIRTADHGLYTGAEVTISGAGTASYNGTFSVTKVSDDLFSIPPTFIDNPTTKGTWSSTAPRSTTQVTVTVIGANDPPIAVNDFIGTSEANEEQLLRILGGPSLSGAAIEFDTDNDYPAKPLRSAVTLLANDDDPDTDDNNTHLRVVGVVSAVHSIADYSGTPGQTPVAVESVDHGLTDGQVILISGYGGHVSYNGFHAVTVVDDNHFTLPIPFVDDHASRGEWAILADETRLRATSLHGADVRLEIRTDPLETSVVYNPRASSYLNGLSADDPPALDQFYYAVADRHGAVSLAKVEILVAGVNDAPEPAADPGSLELLQDLNGNQPLDTFLANLEIAYYLPPGSGTSGRADVAVLTTTNDPPDQVALADVFTTNEETPLDIAASDILANDTDIDRTDVLRVLSVDSLSREGASIALAPDGLSLRYNPTGSARLQSLAREEPLLDTFHLRITDDAAGIVDSLVVVLVTGVNDTPVAVDDVAGTDEDTAVTVNPVVLPTATPDSDIDRDGFAPDNILKMVPEVKSTPPPAVALVTIGLEDFTYDPTVSSFLNGLAVGQTYVESVNYTLMDGSFLFAMDDRFQVAAGGGPFNLSVLANDRNLTGVGSPVSGYAGSAGAAPVRVTAPAHGLQSGMVVSIEGCGGSGPYNRSHVVTVIDANTFSIPVAFVDNAATKGHWTTLRVTGVSVGNQGGQLAIDASGAKIVYQPQALFVGDEVFAYTIVDGLGNVDEAVVSVKVTRNQENGNLQANSDFYAVAKGQSPVLDVLGNDNILPAAGSALTITRILTQPAFDEVSIVDNKIVYHQLNPVTTPYTDSFRYEVSGGGTSRAFADVLVRVINREDSVGTRANIFLRDDAFGVAVDSRNQTLQVLENDGLLPGASEELFVKRIEVAPVHGQVAIDPTSKFLVYSPQAGFIGEDQLTYAAEDRVGGLGLAVVRIRVGALTTSPDYFTVAFDDPGKLEDDGVTTLDVLANDQTVPGPVGTVRLTSVSPGSTSLGTLSVSADGKKLEFDPASNAEGEGNFTYTIEDQSGGRTAQGAVTIVVVHQGVRANPDYYSVGAESLAQPLDVLANDASFPDFGRELTIASLGAGLDGPDHGGTVTIAEGGKSLIYTPASGFVGEETFTYRVTDSRRTDVARVVVTVGTGQLSANNDSFTVFFGAPAPAEPDAEFLLEVLSNDAVLPDFGQVLRITGVGIDDANGTNAPTARGLVRISADGLSLVYRPTNTTLGFPYTERFTYEVSDGTARRADAVVLLEVRERTNVRDVETNDDAYTVERSSLNNRLRVLANDHIKPASASAWIISSVSVPSFGGDAVAVAGEILYTPPPGFIGTETFTYLVSDGLGGTGSATVTVKVGDLPTSADYFVALSGSPTTANDFDVLANDDILAETADDYHLLLARNPSAGGTVSVANGVVQYAPSPTYAGSYPYVETFEYVIRDDSNLQFVRSAHVDVHRTGSDRDIGAVTWTIHGVNDAPTLSFGGPTNLTITDKTLGTKPFATTTIGEVDDQGHEPIEVRVVFDDPSAGRLGSLGGFVEETFGSGVYVFFGEAAAATTAIRGLTFTPRENYVPVDDTWILSLHVMVTDPYVPAPTAGLVVINIQAVNDAPIISGTVANQPVYYLGSIKPFANALLTEVDDQTAQPLVVQFQFDATRGNIIDAAGFVSTTPGIYQFRGTAAAATDALRRVTFAPTTADRLVVNLTPPAGSETTVFTLTVNDGFAPAVTDANTSVVAFHSLIGETTPPTGSLAVGYGYSVAATRTHVVIGAPEEDTTAVDAGAVYIRGRNTGGTGQWGPLKRLVATDPSASARFGHSVAAQGNIIAVGAPGARRGAAGTATSGAVYVFESTAAGANDWQTTAGTAIKIGPADGANGDTFGWSVSVFGDILAVGVPQDDDAGADSGTVYLYRRVALGNWVAATPAKIVGAGIAAGDRFGQSVALSGDWLAIGAPNSEFNGRDSGSAFVYQRTPTSWVQVKRLLPVTATGSSDAAPDDFFGSAVAMDDDVVLVGSPRDDDGGSDRGSAYVFRRDVGGVNSFGRVAKLVGFDALNGDAFGASVALSEGLALVGMPFAGFDNQSRWGTAFVFRQNQGGTEAWGFVEKLHPPDSINNDEFGTSVAIDCGIAVIGARLDDSFAGNAGSSYIFDLRETKAPTILPVASPQTAYVGFPYALTVRIGDADVDEQLTVTARLTGGAPLPSWLTFQASTGRLTGTPSVANVGSLSIVVSATDVCNETASVTFALNVLNTLPPMPAVSDDPLTYAQWVARLLTDRLRSVTSTAGATANPDGDLFTNLEEYAYGTSLFSVNPADGPGLTIGVTVDNRIAVSFRRRSNDAGLTFTLQFSTDMETWINASTLPKEEFVTPIGSAVDLVTCVLTPTPEMPSLFFRVQITAP
ncbi:MAG: tandem-95 repeat protein [Verrucomicrobiales bacterium]|nr:tandem-95 repeat protein [Verrucomicrobiales bacterium]